MAERDPIDLLKEQLRAIETLSTLHATHDTFQQWHGETKAVLEKAFGSKSIHYQSFIALRFREVSSKIFASPEIDKINAQRYRKDLENAKNVLQGALKELTLDRTLFKKIQTTPTTVEVSVKGELFISSGISDPELLKAIESAFEGTGYKAIHFSETPGKENFFLPRIEQIRRARFGIYTLSSDKKIEGLIEVGIALGLAKEIILIHKKGTPLPESVRALNPLEYEGIPDLVEKLRKRID